MFRFRSSEPSPSPSPRGRGDFSPPSRERRCDRRVNDACNQCKGWGGDGAMGSCRWVWGLGWRDTGGTLTLTLSQRARGPDIHTRAAGMRGPAFAGTTSARRVNDACDQCKGWRGDGAMGSCRWGGVGTWVLCCHGITHDKSPYCSVAAPLTTLSTASLTKRGSLMPDSLPSDAEWPIDNMPAMPLSRGMRMVRVASRELRYLHGKVNPSLDRQHVLAVHEAARKWDAEQSRLATEKANRFFTIAKGWPH